MKPGETDDTVAADAARSAGDPRIGSVIDRYTIVRLLGRGGMGAVYEGRHTVLARRAALKFLLPQSAEHPELLKRFENEAKAAGKLEHPNIAAVMDFGRAPDGAPYLVMEYLEGEDCAHLLERYGRLPVGRAVDIVRQACRGLAVAHAAGIVHRDLKPENLFIARSGDGSDWVKVLDFGIAKLIAFDGGVPTRTGAALGTAYYMSPEQARGASDVDRRTDVWSLGVVLYQLLSGERPFKGEQFLHIIHQILSVDPAPLVTLQPDLPPGLLDIVGRAMAKDVDGRIATAEELEAALAPYSERPTVRVGDAPAPRPSPARTEMAPATSVDGVSLGQTGVGPQRELRPSVAPPRRSRAKGLIVVAVPAAAVAGWIGFHAVARSPEGSGSAAALVASAPAPTGLPVTATVASPTPPPSPAPAASASIAPPAASAPVASAELARAAARAGAEVSATRPGNGVRSLSEHFGPSSNTTPPAPPTAEPAPPPAPPAPTPAAPDPAGARGSGSEKRVIDIEKGNPYE